MYTTWWSNVTDGHVLREGPRKGEVLQHGKLVEDREEVLPCWTLRKWEIMK
jgi:hypothetical protein